MSALVSTACAVAIACGGAAAPKPTTVDKPVDTPVESCAPAGAITLPADGTLRCKELPVSITFPPGTKLTRQNDRAMTLYAATLERGAMALIAEPRTDAPTAERFKGLLESLIKGIAPDATTTPIEVPPLQGATVAIGLAFTTPDGGKGVVHGYFANHWLIAAVTGGRLPTTPSRPDQPAGKAFLASLALQPLVTGNRTYSITGATLELPAAAWSIGKQPNENGTISEEVFVSPANRVWIGVRDLEKHDRCDFLAGTAPNSPPDLGDRLKSIYGNTQQPLTDIERAPYGDISVYAHADTGAMHVSMLFACVGNTVLQLTVAGTGSHAELRPQLDAIAKSLKKT